MKPVSRSTFVAEEETHFLGGRSESIGRVDLEWCESERVPVSGCGKIMRGGGHNNFHSGILKVPVKTFF